MFDSTQSPTSIRGGLAVLFGLPESHVEVIAPDYRGGGGEFGGMPEGKTSEAVSGLLYFPMEQQKQRLKDLELVYGGRENRISMRFKPQ